MAYRQLLISGTSITTDNDLVGWVNLSRAYTSNSTIADKIFYIQYVYGQRR
jgi:hypothetical protein